MSDTAPIVVPASAARTQIDTAIGQLVPAIGGCVVAFGLLTPTKWAALAGVLPIVLSAAWRLWASTRKHAQMAVMAAAAPDSVAVVGPAK